MSTRTGPELRTRRHLRVRKKVAGTPERPRLAVFRSNKHIYAQVIDDLSGRTLASASTIADKSAHIPTSRGTNIDEEGGAAGKKEAASRVGKLIAERTRAAGIESVVFDRGGFRYHGRVAAVAEAARAAGLKF